MRRIGLAAGDLTLSALLCEAENPRATVVALHGAGANAHYFDGRAHPDVSFLALGARLGYTMLAVDRPGYRRSMPDLPGGQRISRQAHTVMVALRDFRAHNAVGKGVFLLGHSFGSAVAMTMAADSAAMDILGLEISGWGTAFADCAQPDALRLHWGALRLYPPGTFRSAASILGEVPRSERIEAFGWTATFAEVAARITVPVHVTFAEHEALWRHDALSVRELGDTFHGTPTVLVEHQLGAGHNISLGWAARSYHLRTLGFFDECLVARAVR
ncbi:alpha/beta fold hydrolase [Nocardia callitridis]|uniref:Alpha/beta hydrolase n=1 Tax=Nocardia callitridis TaxID=648753 RepID=A0ABP9K9H8_9NOCA